MIENLSRKQQKKFKKFADLILKVNKTTNLVRVKNKEELYSRHFEDSLVILEKLKTACEGIQEPKLIDIGSGGGFPCIPLAIVLEDWQIFSVESTGKKADFQEMAADKLELDNFTVINSRAEVLGQNKRYREKFDAATSRAVGSLATIAELSVPFIKVGGLFVTLKGPKVEEELKEGSNRLNRLGCENPEIENYTLGEFITHGRIVTSTKKKPTPRKYPREYKVIKQFG